MIGSPKMSTRPYTFYPPPPDEYFIQAKLRKKAMMPPGAPPLADPRERLLSLAEKSPRRTSIFTPNNVVRSSYCSPAPAEAVPPRMGVKARNKSAQRASAVFTSEQSLPEKLSSALKSLRPGGLSHSASSSNVKNKISGVVNADDVVYIPSNDQKPSAHRYSPNVKAQRKSRSIFLRNSPSQSEINRLAQLEDPPLKDLEQIRALYKSSPNVSSMVEDGLRNERSKDRRYSHRYEEDTMTEMSSSTRSPTDSGYRSASRHIDNDHFEDSASSASGSLGLCRKSTTVVLVNDDASPRSPSVTRGQHLRLRCNVRAPHEEETKPSTLPFGSRDVVAVLQARRCRPYSHFLDSTTLPRFVSLLEAPLLLLHEEISRLCTYSLKLTVEEVVTAVKVTFPLDVFSSCIKAGVQATTLFALSGTGALKKSLSRRADLNFCVGRVYRWLIDRMPTKPISDTVAVFLTATLECLLEELILRLIDSDSSRVLSVKEVDEKLQGHKNLIDFFLATDSLARRKCSPMIGISQLIDEVHEIREKIIVESDGSLSGKTAKRSPIRLSRNGIRALHFYVNQSGACKSTDAVPIADWVRIVYAFAEHRMSFTVDDCDVQQASRLILRTFCPPVGVHFWRHDVSSETTIGEARKAFAFQLISTANPENIREAADMLEPDKLSARNAFGLCPLSEAIVQANADAASALLSSNCPVNCAVPSPRVDRRPYLLKEYTGWTPLTWSVAIQKYNLVQILLNAKADVENENMVKESPLQVAVQLNHAECTRTLLEKGADPFKSSIVYDSNHAHFKNSGCASALALAAARGNDTLLRALIYRVTDQKSKSVSVNDFLNGGKSREPLESRTEFEALPKETKLALQEAMYYAVETGRPTIAVDIKESVDGLNWNMYIWTKALQTALEQRRIDLIEKVLADFGAKLAAEISEDMIADCLHVLFGIIRWQCSLPDGDPTCAAAAVSRLHHYVKDAPDDAKASNSASHRPLIDSNFINNQQFSDVKFMVGERPIYGHRIVLINASERFRDLFLSRSRDDVVHIDDVSYSVFLSMLEFVYTGDLREIGDIRNVLPLLPAAKAYGLPALHTQAVALLAKRINDNNFVDLYTYGIEHSIEELVSKCERHLLENFAILVAEAPVRRLILEKRRDYFVPSALTKRIVRMFGAARVSKH
ncbi:hypothetical protein PENTCL1PPCAC_29124 [Pristionchus entomophagus]|uniref:BTB domain-containing protein n=1 Tax=Pristionchus entomophagus TaxID=358040 RepID=A0AAV5UIR5_9BILA|nr:hypothetical protein PENTCL1PPCAC_29124 [Pristionchus entomophagus]